MRCIKNNDLNVNSSSPVISSHGQQKQIDDNVDDAYVDDGDGHDRVGESKTVLSRPVRVKAVQIKFGIIIAFKKFENTTLRTQSNCQNYW